MPNSSAAHDNPAFDPGEVVGGIGVCSNTTATTPSSQILHARQPWPGRKPVVVSVRSGNLAHGKGNKVLNGFSMTVEQGTIYALLGSSGCGKTTLLSCIVGLRTLDSGNILVFGKGPGMRRGSVGYMPQDISLYGFFSIRETLTYFGSLGLMDKVDIERNSRWLVEMLGLPDQSRRVDTLSGGQQRRVSIAVAMINKPPLLILDEPTVGVDPLLRKSIWEHLVDSVENCNTTVIITTHYVEEAKKASTIGLMRGGKLLTEKSPQELMAQHQVTSLESAVLSLCREEDERLAAPKVIRVIRRAPKPSNRDKDPHEYAAAVDPTSSSISGSLRRILAVARKNAMLLFRNFLILLLVLAIPAVEVSWACLTNGKEPHHLPFGVVNHEFEFSGVADCSGLLAQRAKENVSCSMTGFSCDFLGLIPPEMVSQTFFSSEDAARDAIRLGQIRGFMSIPREFSANYLIKTVSSALADEDTLSGYPISFEMDESAKIVSGTLKKRFADTLKEFTRGMLKECGYSARLAEPVVQIVNPIYGNDSPDARQFNTIGMITGILFFMPVLTVSMQYIYETKLGTLGRSLVSGVARWEVTAAFFLTTGISLFIQALLALLIFNGVHEIPIEGSWSLCLLLMTLVGLGGASMGILFGQFFKDEAEAAIFSLVTFFPIMLMSGVLTDISTFPIVFKYTAYGLPLGLITESLRSIVARGWGLTHANVYTGFVGVSAIILLTFLVSFLLQRKRVIV